MFFITQTQFHCSKFTGAELLSSFNGSDPYPPPKVRLNGMLKNTQEYAVAFNCKAGSKMNPRKKCVLW